MQRQLRTLHEVEVVVVVVVVRIVVVVVVTYEMNDIEQQSAESNQRHHRYKGQDDHQCQHTITKELPIPKWSVRLNAHVLVAVVVVVVVVVVVYTSEWHIRCKFGLGSFKRCFGQQQFESLLDH
jgi:uncharacterized membrane protein YkvI